MPENSQGAHDDERQHRQAVDHPAGLRVVGLQSFECAAAPGDSANFPPAGLGRIASAGKQSIVQRYIKSLRDN